LSSNFAFLVGTERVGARRPHRSLDWHKILPFEADAASDRLGWVGLEAARCRAEPAFERNVSALTHHRLVLVARPPDELELRYEGVKRHVAGVVTRGAAEAFDLDPARLTVRRSTA